MDYLEIVIKGFLDENNREYLESYFFREFKKAEKNYFESDEFFNGCLKIIVGWENDLKAQISKRKVELYNLLNAAKNKTLHYGDMEGKSIETKLKETIEHYEKELKDIRPDGIGSITFTVHLQSVSNDRIYYHNLKYSELKEIESAISKAFERTQSKSEGSIFSVLEWSTIFYYADETKLTLSNPIIKARMIDFMTRHNIKTSFNNFKTKYYEAKRRINSKKDYPKEKLRSLLPFLKTNYPQTVTKVDNDISFLEEESFDN